MKKKREKKRVYNTKKITQRNISAKNLKGEKKLETDVSRLENNSRKI